MSNPPPYPTPTDWADLVRRDLARLQGTHLLRRRTIVRPLDATHVEVDGRRLVNFASNNYLGLTHHPAVIAAQRQATDQYGAGTGAAALVSGYGPAHVAAEAAVAAWKGTEAAVLLSSGYQANVAAVQTLAAVAVRVASLQAEAGRAPGGTAPATAGGVRFLLDKLCHASLVDAVRGTGLPMRVFPHNHLGKLDRLLADAGTDTGAMQVVVTESVFSMDGDTADLAGLAELKSRRPFLLLLDEAHGSGVYGPAGGGYAAECGLAAAVDVTVVTLSKALGLVGGAVCAGGWFCDAVVNFGRAYVYSTLLPAPVAAAAGAAIGVMRDEPQRQRRVRDLARRVRAELAAAGFDLPPGDSPIVPVILGRDDTALAAAELLRADGLLVVAIRPPTVPRGGSRLRVTLSSEHTDEEVDRLLRSLRALRAIR